MRIECIAIGTELLTTRRLDTNSVWLGERLAGMGLAFHRKTAVGDAPEDLRALFREALLRSELVVCTGGLGPTFDDLTKEIWAEVAGLPMVEAPGVREHIRGFFTARGREVPESNWKQAFVPEGAEALHNARGTAPGVLWRDPKGFPGRWVVMLPGVPGEMRDLWTTHVEPLLAARAARATHTLKLRVAGVGESALEADTAALRARHGHLDWTILASLGEVELHARSVSPEALESARTDFAAALGEDLVSDDGASLEEAVLRRLRAEGDTLALAESLTGGRVAARLTGVPGASEAFRGGAVAYSAAAKAALADVDPALTSSHGTVSEAVTRALAEGIRDRLGTTWALAVTGNAGPGEDREGPAPVGTCFAAVAGPKGTACEHTCFPGERSDVQTRSATWALDRLRRQMLRAFAKVEA